MKKEKPFTREEVKSANRRYFDISAAVYEKVDGRRGDGLGSYLDARLKEISRRFEKGRLLDLGCGTGFVVSRAAHFFTGLAGVDISKKILREAGRLHPGIDFMAADSDALPFRNGCFNTVIAVALLHHLYDHSATFKEVFRVLQPEGIFYTDHDLEGRFHSLFRLPLMLYRMCRNEEKRYGKACPELTGRIYRATEIHRGGLDTAQLARELESAGFRQVEITFHWLGLSPVFDRLGRLFNREGRCPRGFAPSLSILAVK